MTLNELLVEWSYRTEKGYPDLGNPSDILILETILTELNLPTDILNTLGEDDITNNEDETQISAHSKDDLIKLIQNANLTNPQIQKLFKNISGFAYKDSILNFVNSKGFTSDKFKTGDIAIETIFNNISDSNIDEFIQYIKKPRTLSSLDLSGNFVSQLGLSSDLVRDLINIEPGADAGGSSVGKAEVFLGLMFSDVDNNVSKGDLNWNGKNLEVKGTGGRLGQQSGRGNDNKETIENAARQLLDGELLEEYLGYLSTIKYSMVFSIKKLYESAIESGKNANDIEKIIQLALDRAFYDKGVAPMYFNTPTDFIDPDKIKKNLIKVNSRSYAIKTDVNTFLFLNSSNGDYVIIDMAELDNAIDTVKFDTSVRGVTGYKWYDIAPNMVVRK
jgi:hypothetical protein